MSVVGCQLDRSVDPHSYVKLPAPVIAGAQSYGLGRRFGEYRRLGDLPRYGTPYGNF